MQRIRPLVIAEYPHLKAKELYPVIADRWRSLDAKEKEYFSSEYRNNLLEYSKEIRNFNLTVDEKRQLEQQLTEISTKKQIKSYQKLARQLNKPKRPPCSFLRYLHTQNDRQSDEKYRDYVKRTSSKWQTMSEDAKKEYDAKPSEKKLYRKALLAWEAGVLKLLEDKDANRVHLVRSKQNDSQEEGYIEEEYDEFDEKDV